MGNRRSVLLSRASRVTVHARTTRLAVRAFRFGAALTSRVVVTAIGCLARTARSLLFRRPVIRTRRLRPERIVNQCPSRAASISVGQASPSRSNWNQHRVVGAYRAMNSRVCCITSAQWRVSFFSGGSSCVSVRRPPSLTAKGGRGTGLWHGKGITRGLDEAGGALAGERADGGRVRVRGGHQEQHAQALGLAARS